MINMNQQVAFRAAFDLMCVGLFLLATGAYAEGSVVVRDNFDYATGEVAGLNGGSGSWSGAWDNNAKAGSSEIVTPSAALTYNAGTGAANMGGGNALQLTNVDSIFTPVDRSFTGLSPGQSVYFRFLINLSSSGTWDSDDFFIGFLDSSGGDENATHNSIPNVGLRAANDATAHDFLARTFSPGTTLAVPSVDFVAQTTFLVLALFEDTNSNNRYDTASIWINPMVTDAGSPDATTGFSESSITTSAMSFLGWRFGTGLEAADILLIDDVALTTTFTEAVGVTTIVPEPTSLGLLGAMALAGLHRRRGRS